LFGSQATGVLHAKSDIDIAVISNSQINMPRLTMDLYDLFKREDIDIIDLGIASPTTMYAVVSDGHLLYEKREDAFMEWKMYALWVWRDTAWLRELRDKKLIEWAANVK
jgi:predicted nucleotidyltransferase